MEEQSQKTGVDPRLVDAMALQNKRLEDALRAYYNQHRAADCKGCELCKNAERAFASMARAH
jgi:7-cyano-7-deazaguanine synthase in queuosine biosynthesis